MRDERSASPDGRESGDRWGRYSVVLLAENLSFLRDDPESGACIASAAPKWQRYDKAKFVYDAEALIGTLSLEIPLARSARAAVDEARDAIYKFFSVCVRDPGDYALKALSVTFLANIDDSKSDRQRPSPS